MQGAARRVPPVQMGICSPRSVGPDGSGLRGKPNVPHSGLPKERGQLLDARHKFIDATVAKFNISKLWTGAHHKATTLLSTWEERAAELAERARGVREAMPRVNTDAWHAQQN